MRPIKAFGTALVVLGIGTFGLGLTAAMASTEGCNMQVLANPNPPPGQPMFKHHPTMQCSQATCDDGAPCESSVGMDGGGTYVICLCDESSQYFGSQCLTKKYFSGGNVTNVVCIPNTCLPPLVCSLGLVVPGSAPDANGYYEVRCKCDYPGGGWGE